jgi:hypothetical protein
MPTGYTAKLIEEGQTFPDFVLTCARAFGALAEMHGDAFDAQIPEKFEPSPYYQKALCDAEEAHARLAAMNPAEQRMHGQELKAKHIAAQARYLDKCDYVMENRRVQKMMVEVKAWIPPSDEHKQLKTFMLEQLTLSLNDLSYTDGELAKAHARTAQAYFIAELSNVARNILYYKEELQKEIDRTRGRNDWLKQLRASISQKDS